MRYHSIGGAMTTEENTLVGLVENVYTEAQRRNGLQGSAEFLLGFISEASLEVVVRSRFFMCKGAEGEVLSRWKYIKC